MGKVEDLVGEVTAQTGTSCPTMPYSDMTPVPPTGSELSFTEKHPYMTVKEHDLHCAMLLRLHIASVRANQGPSPDTQSAYHAACAEHPIVRAGIQTALEEPYPLRKLAKFIKY